MIVFDGIDVGVSHKLGEKTIQDAVAAALSIERDQVAVIRDVTKYPEVGAAGVVCLVSEASGDIVELISIGCGPVKVPVSHVLDVVAKLSSIWGVNILTPEEGPNPYLMWLAEPGRAPRQVALDVMAFDQNAYVVASR